MSKADARRAVSLPSEIRAKVSCVVRKVPKGRSHFAVAYPEKGGGGEKLPSWTNITFSLSPDCWQDTHPPQSGQIVVLSNLRRFERGWRAKTARPIRFEDSNSKGVKA